MIHVLLQGKTLLVPFQVPDNDFLVNLVYLCTDEF